MDQYPDYCLRGMFNPDDITKEGAVSLTAYFPKRAEERPDGKSETSIDWEDDEGALPACLGRYQRGVARLLRSHIDEINTFPGIRGILDYERQPLENNERHGNILFPADFMSYSKTHRNAIAGAIAVRAELILHNP